MNPDARPLDLARLLELRRCVLETGTGVSLGEARELLALPETAVPYLAASANEIRLAFNGRGVEICALVNAKSGNCTEDCAFCSQSAHYASTAPVYPLLEAREILRQAREAEQRGADEFCIVTSGRGQDSEKDFEEILRAVRLIREHTQLRVGTSLGFLSDDQMQRLSEAGAVRNNHNLETARGNFGRIVTTHRFDDRTSHVRRSIEHGLEACSGGILGMGETSEQRLEMAVEARDLGISCLPVNILNPQPGTPLKTAAALTPMEIVRTVAVFRFILPRGTIKIAGGRQVNLRDLQAMALAAGANGIILGNYLTTPGRDWKEDLKMIEDLGFEPAAALQKRNAVTASWRS